jgi:hypothetical protein
VPRARRPLIALLVLVAALLIGYTVRAVRSDDQRSPRPVPSSIGSVVQTTACSLTDFQGVLEHT